MKNYSPKNLSPKYFCALFGHNYFLSKHVTGSIKEFSCKSCNQEFTTDKNGDFIILTSKFKNTHLTLEKTYTDRLRKRFRKAVLEATPFLINKNVPAYLN